MELKKRTGTFFLFCILLAYPGCTGSRIKGPAIRFERDMYNFGKALEGEDIQYTFTFSNPGTKILAIEDLLFSCWCIELVECDRITRPGEQGKISVIFKTEGLKGETAKTITVKTNIPGKEPVLTIEGIIE